ncbi:MAG TPA: hypothetical protein VHL09_14395, partial [Dehalococcoidia bacterium]|nr:hypothetical protein [Dehalococcoidia bacterium]
MTADAAGRVRRAAPGDAIDLTLTAADLTALARAYLDRKADLDVRDLDVEIAAPAVHIRGVTALLGRDVRLSVVGVPGVRDRRVQIDLRRVEVNGAPAPKFAVSEIAGFLASKFGSPKLLL